MYSKLLIFGVGMFLECKGRILEFVGALLRHISTLSFKVNLIIDNIAKIDTRDFTIFVFKKVIFWTFESLVVVIALFLDLKDPPMDVFSVRKAGM